MEFEYTVNKIDHSIILNSSSSVIADLLNNMAKKRWELVASHEVSEPGDFSDKVQIFYWKRIVLDKYGQPT